MAANIQIPYYDAVCTRCLCHDCCNRGGDTCSDSANFCVEECEFSPMVTCERYGIPYIIPEEEKSNKVFLNILNLPIYGGTVASADREDIPDTSSEDEEDLENKIEPDDRQKYGKIYEL